MEYDLYEANYIKTRPIHQTQKIISENETTVTIELNVVLNWELKDIIRQKGNKVKVIEPDFLRNEIIEEYRSALVVYE